MTIKELEGKFRELLKQRNEFPKTATEQKTDNIDRWGAMRYLEGPCDSPTCSCSNALIADFLLPLPESRQNEILKGSTPGQSK
jgi:hypothetical protein